MIFDKTYLFINQIFLLLILFLTVWLAFWVYFADRKNIINRLFLLTSFSLLFWWLGGYFFSFSTNLESSLFLGKVILGMVSISFGALYYFITVFPYEPKRNRALDRIIFFLVFVFFFFPVITDQVVQSVELSDWGMNPVYGKGQFFYYGWIAFIMIMILFHFLKKYFKAPQEMKGKIQYFFIGFSIFILMNLVFNVFLPLYQGSIKYWQLGNYSAVFLLGLTAYAIVKQKLFDAKAVLTVLFVGLITVLLSMDAVIFTSDLGLRIIKGSILLFFLVFGYSLIKSVLNEIKLREKLQEAYQKLEKLDKTKSEFISIASHQLRTPLTAVKGYISMVLEGTYGKLTRKQIQPIENVFQSNERLIRLVNDLLNLSRLEAGKIKYEPQLTDLADLVSGIVRELRVNAEKKGLYIKEEPEPLEPFMADSDKLRQVILNIIDNAIKYTQQGGITVKTKKVGLCARVEISDTGAGLEKEEIENLFQMFSRSSAGNQLHTEGAGIGLYVAKQFIEMHKGRVWAESEGSGRGSTFLIELPI